MEDIKIMSAEETKYNKGKSIKTVNFIEEQWDVLRFRFLFKLLQSVFQQKLIQNGRMDVRTEEMIARSKTKLDKKLTNKIM